CPRRIGGGAKPPCDLTLVRFPESPKVMMIGKTEYRCSCRDFQRWKLSLTWTRVVFIQPDLVKVRCDEIGDGSHNRRGNLELIEQNAGLSSQVLVGKEDARKLWFIVRKRRACLPLLLLVKQKADALKCDSRFSGSG